MIKVKQQTADQVVEISEWLQTDEEYSVYPEGAREKNRIICPLIFNSRLILNDPDNKKIINTKNFCIPSHPYLFKRSRPAYPEEFWMEIFAYQLGCLIGVEVPPTFVAYNKNTQEPGALIEWFYHSESETFKRGGDFLVSGLDSFDRKKGRKHNFQSIVQILSDPSQNLEENWIEDFVKILMFDALIGNTDRHQENWGVIYTLQNSKGRMAPAFDNGDSMGREIQEQAFQEFDNFEKLKKYVINGRPHLKWALDEDHDKRDNHEKLLQKIVGQFPNLRSVMNACLQFSEQNVLEILENLKEFEVPVRLTEKRGLFMLKLLQYRQKRLLELLNGDPNAFH